MLGSNPERLSEAVAFDLIAVENTGCSGWWLCVRSSINQIVDSLKDQHADTEAFSAPMRFPHMSACEIRTHPSALAFTIGLTGPKSKRATACMSGVRTEVSDRFAATI